MTDRFRPQASFLSFLRRSVGLAILAFTLFSGTQETMTVNDFKTEMRAIDQIKPYEKNLRKIPESAIDKVGLSLATNNWRQPIVVDVNGVIVVGTVRWLAARRRGMDFVLVHVAADLTPEEIREYRIMDNRCHDDTDWDWASIKLEMMELKALDFNLSFTGFEPREIDEFLARMTITWAMPVRAEKW